MHLILASNRVECRSERFQMQVATSSQAIQETGLDEAVFPESCTWTTEQILNQDFLPD